MELTGWITTMSSIDGDGWDSSLDAYTFDGRYCQARPFTQSLRQGGERQDGDIEVPGRDTDRHGLVSTTIHFGGVRA